MLLLITSTNCDTWSFCKSTPRKFYSFKWIHVFLNESTNFCKLSWYSVRLLKKLSIFKRLLISWYRLSKKIIQNQIFAYFKNKIWVRVWVKSKCPIMHIEVIDQTFTAAFSRKTTALVNKNHREAFRSTKACKQNRSSRCSIL